MIDNLLNALNFGTQLLSEHQVDQPRVNAEIILSHLLKLERIDLYLNHDKPITSSEFVEYLKFLNKRTLGIPIQYLTHWVDFFSYRFLVEEGVFIPRKDTEVLVEEIVKQLNRNGNITILDLCTGCGNIAISLALEFPLARVYGTDISSKAISVAIENTRRLGVIERVKFLMGDLFEPVSLGRSADLIVSNPPYIKKSDLGNLPKEVKAEPLHTYYGGEDGLNVIRKIIVQAREYLSRGGMLAIEVGYDQARTVKNLMEECGYRGVKIVRDLGGNERVIIAYQ